MASSYLGICSSRGLEALITETAHALPFLMRRIYDRGRCDQFCCWMLISDQQACFIRSLIESGYNKAALMLVNMLATDFGTIPPEYDDAVPSAS